MGGCLSPVPLDRPNFKPGVVPSASWLDGTESRHPHRPLDTELPPQQVVFIGAPGCGKTTLITHISEICGDGLTNIQRLSFKPVIFRNTRDAIHQLAIMARELHELDNCPPISDESKANLAVLERYHTPPPSPSASPSSNVGSDGPEDDPVAAALRGASPTSFLHQEETWDACNALWNDDAIQCAWKTSTDRSLNSNQVTQFVSRIDEIRSSEYVPSLEDILRCTVRGDMNPTSEATITYLDIKYQLSEIPSTSSHNDVLLMSCRSDLIVYTWSMVEGVERYGGGVGSSESDSASTSVATGYNDFLSKSVESFGGLINSADLADHNVLLVLNKKDLFDEMLSEHSFRELVPEYDGSDDDRIHIIKFIKHKFKNVFDTASPPLTGRRMRVLCLNSLDASCMDALMFDMKRMAIHGFFDTPRIILPS